MAFQTIFKRYELRNPGAEKELTDGLCRRNGNLEISVSKQGTTQTGL